MKAVKRIMVAIIFVLFSLTMSSCTSIEEAYRNRINSETYKKEVKESNFINDIYSHCTVEIDNYNLTQKPGSFRKHLTIYKTVRYFKIIDKQSENSEITTYVSFNEFGSSTYYYQGDDEEYLSNSIEINNMADYFKRSYNLFGFEQPSFSKLAQKGLKYVAKIIEDGIEYEAYYSFDNEKHRLIEYSVYLKGSLLYNLSILYESISITLPTVEKNSTESNEHALLPAIDDIVKEVENAGKISDVSTIKNNLVNIVTFTYNNALNTDKTAKSAKAIKREIYEMFIKKYYVDNGIVIDNINDDDEYIWYGTINAGDNKSIIIEVDSNQTNKVSLYIAVPGLGCMIQLLSHLKYEYIGVSFTKEDIAYNDNVAKVNCNFVIGLSAWDYDSIITLVLDDIMEYQWNFYNMIVSKEDGYAAYILNKSHLNKQYVAVGITFVESKEDGNVDVSVEMHASNDKNTIENIEKNLKEKYKLSNTL